MKKPGLYQSYMAHLDPRADNYFAYDKQEQCYVIAQTWQARVHKVGEPKDKYEIVYFRAARRFDTEPSNDDIKKFAAESEAGFKEHMKMGTWTSDETEPFRFNRWYIKDFREQG